jgi:hypothetical protein
MRITDARSYCYYSKKIRLYIELIIWTEFTLIVSHMYVRPGHTSSKFTTQRLVAEFDRRVNIPNAVKSDYERVLRREI